VNDDQQHPDQPSNGEPFTPAGCGNGDGRGPNGRFERGNNEGPPSDFTFRLVRVAETPPLRVGGMRRRGSKLGEFGRRARGGELPKITPKSAIFQGSEPRAEAALLVAQDKLTDTAIAEKLNVVWKKPSEGVAT
jgi:hypothetical protein